tara:strand:+ start:173 stop:571 length:399 start_codon:yes stop_codon:yes gene_type:complete
MNTEIAENTQKQTDAIKILVEGVKRGQAKGCYTLEEATIIWTKGCLVFMEKNEMENTDKEAVAKRQTQQTEGIKILIEAVRQAQNSGKNGCYSLEEAAVIHSACSMFIQNTKPEQEQEQESESENLQTGNPV